LFGPNNESQGDLLLCSKQTKERHEDEQMITELLLSGELSL